MNLQTELAIGAFGLEDLDDAVPVVEAGAVSVAEVQDVVASAQVAEAASELKEVEQEIATQTQSLDILEDRREDLEEQVAGLEDLLSNEKFDRHAVRFATQNLVRTLGRYGVDTQLGQGAGTEDIADVETAKIVLGSGLEAVGETLKKWGQQAWELVKKIFASIVQFFTSLRNTTKGIRAKAASVKAKVEAGELKDKVKVGGWGSKITVGGSIPADVAKAFSDSKDRVIKAIDSFQTEAAKNFSNLSAALKAPVSSDTAADVILGHLRTLEYPVPQGATQVTKGAKAGFKRYAITGLLGGVAVVVDVKDAPAGAGMDAIKGRISAFNQSGAGVVKLNAANNVPAEISAPTKQQLQNLISSVDSAMTAVDNITAKLKLNNIESQLKASLTGTGAGEPSADAKAAFNAMKSLPGSIARSFSVLPVKLSSALIANARSVLEYANAAVGGKEAAEEKPAGAAAAA